MEPFHRLLIWDLSVLCKFQNSEKLVEMLFYDRKKVNVYLRFIFVKSRNVELLYISDIAIP